MKSSNKTIRILILLSTLAVLGLLIKSGYRQSWTGFHAYESKGEVVPSKKLWDWMDLLVVPLGLAIAAFYLNQRQKESELQKTTNQQREANLQAFISQMSDLLLTNNLRKSEMGDGVRTIARARTLTVLKELDGKRKGLMIRFLLESRLLQREGKTFEEELHSPIISLTGADLTNADLSHMDLSKVVFNGVDLTGANLEFSSLKEVEKDLNTRIDHKWDLVWKLGTMIDRPAKDALRGQDLRNADLSELDLSDFDLSGTDFRGSILDKARLFNTTIDARTRFDPKWQQVWRIVNNSNPPTKMNLVDLTHANLSFKVFTKANFSGCDLQGTAFAHSQLSEANFQGVSAFDADFTGTTLRGSDLSGARLALSSFEKANLSNARLSKADLTWTNLSKANFENADLSEVDFTAANLCGADLTGANLTNAKFSDTKFDMNTKWPAGFTPATTLGLKPKAADKSPETQSAPTPEEVAAMNIELLNVPY